MKDSQNITLAEIQQKIDVIEIQLKMLFESYQNFVKDFLM
jgi:uncharacterized protein YsxB (DUF464 family)